MKKIFCYALLLTYFFRSDILFATNHASKERLKIERQNILKLKIKTLDGLNFELNNSQNNQLIIVNFWAYWCGICKSELKILEKIYQKYRHRGVEIIGISIDEKSKILQVEKIAHKLSFQNGFFGDGKITINEKNINPPNSIPETYFVNNKGEIIEIYKGEIDFEEIEKIINKVVAKPPLKNVN